MWNRLVIRLLRSPFHRLLSRSVAVLTVTGRRSGRPLSLPVNYLREGDRVTVVAGRAPEKTWWRNLGAEPAPVTLRLRGEDHVGAARLVRGEEIDELMLPYLQRFPQAWRGLGVEPQATEQEVAAAAQAAVVIAVDLR